MKIETANLHQKAVLWAVNGYDRNGEPRLGSPIEIDVRWESGQVEAMDAEGAPIAATATVFVDRVITLDSQMWLGKLTDLPVNPTNLKRVVDYREVPDIKGRRYQRTVVLMRK